MYLNESFQPFYPFLFLLAIFVAIYFWGKSNGQNAQPDIYVNVEQPSETSSGGMVGCCILIGIGIGIGLLFLLSLPK